MDLIKNTAGYKETGNDYTLEDFEEEELLDDQNQKGKGVYSASKKLLLFIISMILCKRNVKNMPHFTQKGFFGRFFSSCKKYEVRVFQDPRGPSNPKG